MSVVDPAAFGEQLELAEEAVRTERRRLADELKPLTDFRECVRDAEPHRGATLNAAAVRPVSTASAGESLEEIRDAYASTFMAVSHYEEDYGESFETSVAEEFGPDVASILTRGEKLSRTQKRVVVRTVTASIESRTAIYEQLDAELSSVHAARETLVPLADELSEIDSAVRSGPPVEMVDAYDARLNVLESKCQRLLDDRQSTLVEQRRSLSLPIGDPDVPRYLYRSESVDGTYPVLNLTADCVHLLESVRAEIRTKLREHRQSESAERDR